MCTLCVEIMRGRITVKDALDGLRSEFGATGWTPRGAGKDHELDLLDAHQTGNVAKVEKLVKEGYKKERWL